MSEISDDPGFEYKHGVRYENIATLKARIFQDIVPDQLLETEGAALGLAPRSPDVAAADKAAAVARAYRVAELLPVIFTLSGLSSQAIAATILGGQQNIEVPPEFPHLVLASNVALVSNLLDLGLLSKPGEHQSPNGELHG